ncbi:MAG: DUF1570 domain-containing protein [Phycisphaerales bacterium]
MRSLRLLGLAALLMLPRAAVAHPTDGLPIDSPVLADARAARPEMRMRSSEHYVLLTDAPMEHADDVLDLLETTHDIFHREMRKLGLEPAPLRHRLVAVLFRDQDDYLKFMAEVDRVQQAWASGYYSQRNDRLVIFDALTAADVQQARRGTRAGRDRARGAAGRSGGRVLETGGSGSRATEAERAQDRQRAAIVRQADDRFVGTVTHEAAHQLFFHTRVQDPAAPHAYPLWLSEGLATNFEADEREDGDFGFGAHNESRRQAKQEAVRKDALIPLRVMIGSDRIAPNGGQPSREALGTFYAQAHVFTQWLARHRTAELRHYLQALREAPPVVPAERRRNFEQVFEAVFGPIDAVERVWLRHEAQAWPEFWETEWGRRLKAFDRRRPVDAAGAQSPASPPGSAP